MKLSTIFSLAAFSAAASAIRVSYDTGYDNGARSLNDVACSDGKNGLITRYGWTTQGAVPTFPRIGGVADVAGWDSPSCGTCWKLTYGAKSIYVLAIDHANVGFNIALDALNTLTNGQGVALGAVDATSELVASSLCNVPA